MRYNFNPIQLKKINIFMKPNGEIIEPHKFCTSLAELYIGAHT